MAGLGAVGLRKLSGLLANGVGAVTARDTRPFLELDHSVQAALKDPRVIFRQGQCSASDIADNLLVFACTGSEEENRRIAGLCRDLGVLCNCASAPQESGFILPSVARGRNLCCAISTCGQSPYLAKIWKNELEAWLEPHERLAWLLGRLRPLVLALNLSQRENAALFERIAASPLAAWLDSMDNIDKCHEWLKSELPAGIAGHLPQIFSEFVHAFS